MYLEQWKAQIPNLPEINFDVDAQNTFEEIKEMPPSVYRALFSDQKIFNEIVLTIFPEKKTLLLLLDYFKSKRSKIYKTLSDLLYNRLNLN